MITNSIRLSSFAVARALGALSLLLVLASIGGQFDKYWLGSGHFPGLADLFYLDAEKNIPTIFSVFLLFFAAVLLTVITIFKKKNDPDVTKWAILAFGFLYMTVDEGMSIHEKLRIPMHRFFGDVFPSIFHFVWVIPGIAVICVLTLFFAKFLRRLPAKTRSEFVIAATLFIGGAIGMEMVGGWYAHSHGLKNLTYSIIIVTLEESLEMAGVIVFIYALLEYIADNYNLGQFRFDDFEGKS